MRSKAIFMALLALTFVAQGAPVSDATARLAAGSWAVSDASLGVPHGKSVGEARAYSVDGTNGFYAVSLEGGGTLFLAADDEIDPVLGFTAAAEVDLSEESPLRNLLSRDIAARRGKLAAEARQTAPTPRFYLSATPAADSAAAPSGSRAKKLWAAFTAGSQETSGQSEGGRLKFGATAAPRKSIAVSDMRVEPLLASKWSQQKDKFDNNCYNYYTPNNYPCGCVATAAGQILYYWKCPQGDMPKFSGDCKVDGVSTKLDSHGDSRLYDWDAMVGVPDDSTPESGRQAIGALLYDLGVAFKAEYSKSGTGALEADVAGPLREHFGLASAYTYSSRSKATLASSLHTAPTRQRVILANLDAKRPVELYIVSEAAGGHAVVADGYGYVTIAGVEVEFTHLNMGWAGTDDMWYNLPTIQTKESGAQSGQSGGYTFEYLIAATFNMHPTETGDLLTGRITDGEGAFPGVTVSVYKHGSPDAPVAVTNSDEHGIYSFTLPGGAEYDIAAAAPDGRRKGVIEGVQLKATTVSDTTTYVTASPSDIGNSWGNDLALVYPCVRIVTGVETNEYTTLDGAIDGARAIAASTGGVPEMEILRDAELRADATVDFDCILRAASGDESSMQVDRPNGAAITVAAGASLLASNCVFEATGRVPLVAEAGGKVYVGPGFAAERVATVDAAGFNIVGFVTTDIAVECSAATEEGFAFGKATTDDPEALGNSVAMLYATFDDGGNVRGLLQPGAVPGEYVLVWSGGVPVPVDASVGYYVRADGSTNTAFRVDSLFAIFENERQAGLLPASPEIVLRGRDADGPTNDVVVSCPLVLRGESGAFLSPTKSSHIVVASGGSLVVKNLVIGDRPGDDTLIRVLNGGSITLGAGAVVTNIVCNGNLDKLESGPVAVMSGGILRLEPGSAIVGCSASGNSLGGKFGGGVYVDAGGTLDLAGGAIRNCQTVYGYGGGVYAKKGANVVVSGPSVVSGNLGGKSKRAEDVYFADAGDSVSVTASAAGGSIGVKYSSSEGNAPEFVFAEAASAACAAASKDAFFSDADAARTPKVVNVSALAWSDPSESASSGPTDVSPTDPSAVVRVNSSGEEKYWASLSDAFAYLEDKSGSATITLLDDCWFDTNVVVRCNVTLVSANAAACEVSRLGDASVVVEEGASLTVSNVVFRDFAPIPAQQPLFSVPGGSLELQSGAEVRDVVASGRFGAAVTVTCGEAGGGKFTMRDGALIADCRNAYDWPFDSTAYAGGLLLDGEADGDEWKTPRAYLYGGVITNCVARRSGGVFAGNGSEVHVSGAIDIVDNLSITGADANLKVADHASLVLDGAFTGRIGVGRDVAADRVVFGRVGASLSDDNLVKSAMNFTGDEGQGYGVPVRAADRTTLLAWSGRISEDGTYVDADGKSYSMVFSPATPFPVDVPVGVVGLVYDGTVQTGVVSRLGYSVSGTFAAADAGDYSATASLSSGYAWSDGAPADRDVPWTIAKATYDMGGVTFEDAVYLYDGEPKSLEVSGALPEGVEVSYDGNDWSLPGVYVVTASFKGDAGNYEPIPDMTATLAIVKAIARPTALADLVYNAAEQSGVAAGEGYSLAGDVSGVDAGTNYTAVASLDDNSVWPDGSTNDIEIVWSINPAPLTVVASNAWKYVSADDPLPFEYGVDGLQGADAASDVLVGALDRTPGEDEGNYAISRGDLRIADGVKNYFIDGFTLGWLNIRAVPTSVLPDLPAGATAADVAQALADAGLADGDVAAGINGASDPVAEYNDFRNWADTVSGGQEAVAASSHAWASYEFGATELFENEPTVTFTSMSIEDPATASMNVRLVVKDGDAEKDVDPESVAKLFEVSANLVTWTDEVTVTPNPDGSYTVKPDDPTLKAAFIRLKY